MKGGQSLRNGDMAQMLEGQTEVTSVCLEGDRYRQASDDHFNELSIIGCRVNNGLPPGASGPLTRAP